MPEKKYYEQYDIFGNVLKIEYPSKISENNSNSSSTINALTINPADIRFSGKQLAFF